MLKIGDFSKLSRISIRMLRYFDEKDLLKPFKIDDMTSYRYYHESQLTTACTIIALQQMGFSIAIISEILSYESNPKKLEEFFSEQKNIITENYQNSLRQLQLLETSLNQIRKDEYKMKYSVILKDFPTMKVASLRQIIPSYQDEGMLWQQLMPVLTNKNVSYPNPYYSLAIFHDKEYKEDNVDVEIQVSIEGNYSDEGNVHFKERPSILVASVTFKGNYDQVSFVNETVAHWVSDNNYIFDGPMFNIYHVSPATESNPDNWVTECCFPVRKK